MTKLINQIMLDGKRGTAQHICYTAFETVAEKTGKSADEVFNAALANVAPQLEVKARRVGGATYQVPIEIRPERRQTLALRWLCLLYTSWCCWKATTTPTGSSRIPTIPPRGKAAFWDERGM